MKHRNIRLSEQVQNPIEKNVKTQAKPISLTHK